MSLGAHLSMALRGGGWGLQGGEHGMCRGSSSQHQMAQTHGELQGDGDLGGAAPKHGSRPACVVQVLDRCQVLLSDRNPDAFVARCLLVVSRVQQVVTERIV